MVWIWSYQLLVLIHIQGYQDLEVGTEDKITILGGAEATIISRLSSDLHHDLASLSELSEKL